MGLFSWKKRQPAENENLNPEAEVRDEVDTLPADNAVTDLNDHSTPESKAPSVESSDSRESADPTLTNERRSSHNNYRQRLAQQAQELTYIGYGGPGELSCGPWDISDAPADLDLSNLYDFGAVKVAGVPGATVKIVADEESQVFCGVIQMRDNTFLRCDLFAAPKSSGIWESDRENLCANFSQIPNCQIQESEGNWGKQILVFIPNPENPDEGSVMRFLGVDGPRWFMRVTLGGLGAINAQAAQPFLQALANYVVDRGDRPAPAGEGIALTPLKKETLVGDEKNNELPDIISRGPEITEVR